MCVSVCVCMCMCVSTHYIVLHTPPQSIVNSSQARHPCTSSSPVSSLYSLFFLVCRFFVLFLSFHRLNMRHKKTKKATPIWLKKQQSATKKLLVGQFSACEELPSRHLVSLFPFLCPASFKNAQSVSQHPPLGSRRERKVCGRGFSIWMKCKRVTSLKKRVRRRSFRCSIITADICD